MEHKKVNKRSPLNQMLSVGIILYSLMISSIDATNDKDNADNTKKSAIN
tara:strand:- start:2079 stop:2225 length:147 start_codon:yes stop_codon:yes gene_type:complete